MLIVGRAIAGAGSTGIGTGALTIIAAVLPRRAQPRFLGINMGIGQLGLAVSSLSPRKPPQLKGLLETSLQPTSQLTEMHSWVPLSVAASPNTFRGGGVRCDLLSAVDLRGRC